MILAHHLVILPGSERVVPVLLKWYLDGCWDYAVQKLLIIMMNGKEEWSVKIFCDRKVLLDQIDEVSKDAAILEEKIMASSPGKAYLLQRKKTELVKTEMVRICNEFSRSCFNKFKSLSNSCIMINLDPDEVQKRKNAIILNVSIFISSDEVDKLKKIYDVICKNYGISGFSIEASGPANLERMQDNELVNKCN